jgi:alpha-acetolactate decarboxylase
MEMTLLTDLVTGEMVGMAGNDHEMLPLQELGVGTTDSVTGEVVGMAGNDHEMWPLQELGDFLMATDHAYREYSG